MLNVVVIEGYVTNKVWHWGGDLCFRLASYRDPHLPQKPPPPASTNHDQAADYLTVRVVGGAPGGLPVAIHPGQRVRVHGFVGSRPFRRTLTEVAQMTQGGQVGWKPGFDPNKSFIEDEVVEVIAEQILTLSRAQEETSKNS